jgi:hypothetical protein
MNLSKVVLFGLAMTTPVVAHAGNLTADCDSWEDSGFWDVACPANITATALLQRFDDATSAWVDVETSVSTATVGAFGNFSVGGNWSAPLDGTYRVLLDFAAEVMCGETHEMWHFTGETTFECMGEEPPPPPPPPPPPEEEEDFNDARTPGYWKNHPESWPVTSLTIGGQTYSQDCLLAFLSVPTRGDVRIKLIHHLIAAKLNLLPNLIEGIGSTDPSIQPTVDAADQFLIDTGTVIDCGALTLSGSLSDDQRDASNELKDALDAYNNNEAMIGSSSSGLRAAGEGGCTSVSRESGLELFALPLLALFFVRSRRRFT